jgi:hypothetical protein
MWKRVLLLSIATLSVAQETISRKHALAEALSAEILASRSATATLEKWCRERKLTAEPKIVANLIPVPRSRNSGQGSKLRPKKS